MATTLYTTIDGDRWDTIAYKAYGDPKQMALIIAANTCAIVDTFVGGIDLIIPIIQPSTIVDTSLLPPWKQTVATPITTEVNNTLTLSTNLPGSFSGSFD